MTTQILLLCLAMGIYSLVELFRSKTKKCLQILDECKCFFSKNKSKFTSAEQAQFSEQINSISQSKDLKQAITLKGRLREKQSFFNKATSFLKGWIFPFVLVFGIIKPMWFEFMQIPTGSMRPTFKEGDAISISKLQFSANIPMLTKHLMFDDDEIKRMATISFTSENLEGNNTWKYFYVIPGYKQFTKRLIAKGGDSIYYYGGKLYGVDKHGNDISSELQPQSLNHIEHIPYISMQARFKQDDDTSFILKQSGQKIAKITYQPFTTTKTEMIDGVEGKHDIFNLWGIEGFAKFQLVKKEDLKETISMLPESLQGSDFYLELTHHPSIHKSDIQTSSYFYPIVHEQKSYIPIKQQHMNALAKALYSARFIVENGKAKRYEYESSNQKHPINLTGIEDGTYEYFYGQCYKIGFLGISTKLKSDHPLMNLSQENLFNLVNLGIELDTQFLNNNSPFYSPSRYAYYKDGDLYAMGGKIFDKNDETLLKFQAVEKRKEQINNDNIAFIDPSAPLDSNGNLDVKKIRTYGITVPDNHYFMLGDNHAMSGDSREFGMVPKENLKGTPTFIFWGPNERFGSPKQPSYKVFTKPRTIVWSLTSIGFIVYFILKRRKKIS